MMAGIKRRKKGDVTLMFLALVIAVVMVVVLLGGAVANYFSFAYQVINIKGKISVAMVNDDAGTQLVSLLGAKTADVDHMELLGWYNTEGITEDKAQYIDPVKATLDSYTNYDFSMTGTRPASFQAGVPPVIQDSAKSELPGCGIATSDSISLRWPVPSSKTISSGFGGRELKKGECDCHGGIDIAGDGQNVYAALGGIVVDIYTSCSVGDLKCNHGYGNYIVVEHKIGLNNYRTYYDHLKAVNVKIGDEVGYEDAGSRKVIGISGNTGWSTGPHLHFEIRKFPYAADRDSINPCSMFQDASGTTGSCTHEQVAVCRYVASSASTIASGTTVSSYEAEIPLPGAASGIARGTVTFKQWD